MKISLKKAVKKIVGKAIKKIALRLYLLGNAENNMRIVDINKKNSLANDSTVFYSNSNVVNLSMDRNKIQLGSHCHVYGTLVVYPYSGKIEMGDHCSLGDNSRIVSGKKISIGNRVMIAHNVNILDNNSHPVDAKLRHEDFLDSYSVGMKPQDLNAKEIVIEDDVWIGFNSIIFKGVTIGTGAIIGAGSIVTKDVEPWTVNVGNPLKCIKRLNPVNVLCND